MLKAEHRLAFVNKKSVNSLFIWFVQKSVTNTCNDIWSISNYVDNNVGFKG